MIRITKAYAGKTNLGDVDAITLSNNNGMSVTFLTLGATMQRMVVPDNNGSPIDVLLGCDTPQNYLDGTAYLGGTIGRYANRIGGAGFSLDGKRWNVTANQNGVHTLHGGAVGYDKRIWDCDVNHQSVTFRLTDCDGTEGFPGTVSVELNVTLSEDNRLTITHHATCDAPTVLNITHHPYFNLNGHNAGTIDDHYVQVNTLFYTPTDDAGIPNGEIRAVEGSPVDVRVNTRLGTFTHHPDLTVTRGLDHNFVLANHDCPCLTLGSEETGIQLEVETTLPGVQVYTGGYLPNHPGKASAVYANHAGVAIEPQYFPHSMEYAHFPSPVLRPGDTYHHQISYQFSTGYVYSKPYSL